MKVIIYVEKGDLKINWNDCSKTEQKEIGFMLNKQGLRAIGYFPKEK